MSARSTVGPAPGRIGRRRFARWSLVAAAAALAPARVLSTHEVHHRFTVWGEVRYADGAPADGVDVELLGKDGTTLGTFKTNAQGRYRVVLHVHDEDLRKVVDVRVGTVLQKVRVLFEPSDHVTERGRRVDFTVPR